MTANQAAVQSLINEMESCQNKFNKTPKEIDKMLQRLKTLTKEYSKYQSMQNIFLSIKDRLKHIETNTITESQLIEIKSQIDIIRQNRFEFIDDIMRESLSKEKAKIREELHSYYQQNTNETNKEFCTLLAMLLVFLFVIIIIIAWKAEDLFCGSTEMDIKEL